MVTLDWYGIAVIAFLGLSLVVGTFTSKLVKKSSKRYMVIGKSLPLFFSLGQCLPASIHRWQFMIRKCFPSIPIRILGGSHYTNRASSVFNSYWCILCEEVE